MLILFNYLIKLKLFFMKIKIQVIVLAAISALFFAACSAPVEAPKPVDTEKIKPEIQAMEDAFAKAEKEKSVDGVVAYYSDDAISYNRNEPPSVGKAAIKEKIAKQFASDTLGLTHVYKVVDLFADGNMVTEVGSFTNLNAAGAEVDKGFYMSCFQKRDGKYVCVRDMSVTTTPVKGGVKPAE